MEDINEGRAEFKQFACIRIGIHCDNLNPGISGAGLLRLRFIVSSPMKYHTVYAPFPDPSTLLSARMQLSWLSWH